MKADLNAVLMVLAGLVWLVVLPFAAYAALWAPMAFEGPGGPRAWSVFVFVGGFPLLCLFAPLVGWLVLRTGRRGAAWAVMALPLAWIALGALIGAALGMRG